LSPEAQESLRRFVRALARADAIKEYGAQSKRPDVSRRRKYPLGGELKGVLTSKSS
jgi:hypothetical protein